MTRIQTAVPIHAARQARKGDPRALLAIPEARADIPRLIRGDRLSKWARRCGATAADFTGRKTIAAAKALVAEREARRAARKVAEQARTPQPGRILAEGARRAAVKREALRQQTDVLVTEAFSRLYRTYSDMTSVTFGAPGVNVRTTTKWVSGRCGFGRVTDGQTTTLTVPPTWAVDVQDRGLDYVDGLLTLAAELVESTDGIEVFRATWVRQGRGYELYAESGYIARHPASGTTYHSPSPEPRKALAGIRRKLSIQAIPAEVRTARAAAAAATRATRQAAGIARLVEQMARWDFTEVAHVVVRRSDSLKAGNCIPGTDEFIERFFPDRSPDSSATIGEIAARVGRLDPAMLRGADLTLARQLAAACLVAVRKDRTARRALAIAI